MVNKLRVIQLVKKFLTCSSPRSQEPATGPCPAAHVIQCRLIKKHYLCNAGPSRVPGRISVPHEPNALAAKALLQITVRVTSRSISPII